MTGTTHDEQEAALEVLQAAFCEVLYNGQPTAEQVHGERFPANLAALHSSPTRREWLVIGNAWIWAVTAGVSGPLADEKGIDVRRVVFDPALAATVRAAAARLPTLHADPGE